MGQVFQTTLCAIIILILQLCVPVSAVSSPAEIMTSQIPAGYGITRNTDGMVEIFIPAGTFWMGNEQENPMKIRRTKYTSMLTGLIKQKLPMRCTVVASAQAAVNY